MDINICPQYENCCKYFSNISYSQIIFNKLSSNIYIYKFGYVPINIVLNRELYPLFLYCFSSLNDPFFNRRIFVLLYLCKVGWVAPNCLLVSGSEGRVVSAGAHCDYLSPQGNRASGGTILDSFLRHSSDESLD